MSEVSARVARRQRALLAAAYAAGRVFARVGRRVSWVVGAEEIAGMVAHVGAAIPESVTVVRAEHRFYADRYDVVLQRPGTRREVWRRLYLGPLVLGWWSARARGVIYIGAAGFLDGADERRHEFAFLRGRRRAVVCCFTGGDIRSPALMSREAELTGTQNIGSILFRQGAPFDEPDYEEVRRIRAEAADEYANVIITARVDQMSYLTSPTEPFLYFYPDERFVESTTKFDDLTRIIVLHAPSNPTLKGTALVRTAMARVTERFPHVEYRELEGVPNSAVLAALDEAHIVLNQFYAQMPGVFGIEAMARAGVMVCSADPDIETDLADARGAWVVASPTDLEERLTELVSAPERLEEQALRGLQWSRTHASGSASGAALRTLLERAAAAARRSGHFA